MRGDVVNVNTEKLYKKYGSHLTFCDIIHYPKHNDDPASYDLLDREYGNILCMNGEKCVILEEGDTILLKETEECCEQFRLSLDEFETAVSDDGWVVKLPARPGTVMYELKTVMEPKDGSYQVRLEIVERTFYEHDLFKMTLNSLYGIDKNVFRTMDAAVEAARQIQERGINVVHVIMG